MKKQPEITVMTRQNIIDAFWSLYKENKIEHISIRRLMEVAGYNRSTFYDHFVDIYDVLHTLEDSLLLYVKDALNFNPITISENKTNDFLTKLETTFTEKGEYFYVLLGENGDSNFVNKYKEVLKPALHSAFDIPIQENDSQTELMIEFSLSAIIGSLAYYHRPNVHMTSEELTTTVNSLLTNGLMTELYRFKERSEA